MATGQVVAAVAILAKSKGQLVALVAAAGQSEAAAAQDALTRALAAADTLAAIFALRRRGSRSQRLPPRK